MKITLLVHGTRGDVQPMAMLGLALQARGHEVVFGVPVNLVGFAEKLGLPVVPIAVDSQALLESPEGRGWLRSGDMAALISAVNAANAREAAGLDETTLAACEGADVLVAGVLMEDRAACVSEARGIPLIVQHQAPLRPTGTYANSYVRGRPLPFGFLNKATHALFQRAQWQGNRKHVNAFRQKLGLAPTRLSTAQRCLQRGVACLQAYSAHIVPQPADWGEENPVTGFLFLEQEERVRLGEHGLDPALEEWLDAGSAPVFLGFGSMPIDDPAAVLANVERVSGELGLRAVVGAGWSNFEAAATSPTARVRLVGAVDHDALLPRCTAAVHHGGAGTTATVLRAGLPSMVCSVFVDQPFWAGRLEDLGLGIHTPFRRFDEHALAQGLVALQDDKMRERAKVMSERLRAEDARGAAVRVVERHACRAAGRPAAREPARAL